MSFDIIAGFDTLRQLKGARVLGEWSNEEAAALQKEFDAYEVARLHAGASPRSKIIAKEMSATDRCLLTFRKAYRLLAACERARSS